MHSLLPLLVACSTPAEIETFKAEVETFKVDSHVLATCPDQLNQELVDLAEKLHGVELLVKEGEHMEKRNPSSWLIQAREGDCTVAEVNKKDGETDLSVFFNSKNPACTGNDKEEEERQEMMLMFDVNKPVLSNSVTIEEDVTSRREHSMGFKKQGKVQLVDFTEYKIQKRNPDGSLYLIDLPLAKVEMGWWSLTHLNRETTPRWYHDTLHLLREDDVVADLTADCKAGLLDFTAHQIGGSLVEIEAAVQKRTSDLN